MANITIDNKNFESYNPYKSLTSNALEKNQDEPDLMSYHTLQSMKQGHHNFSSNQ